MITPERYAEVLNSSLGKQYSFVVGAPAVAILHGLMTLAMDHPGLQELSGPTMEIARGLRDWSLACLKDMGFSDEEMAQLQTMREVENPNELRLGPRLIMLSGMKVGTCAELSFNIGEATEQEIADLETAHVISLVKMAKG